MLQKNTGGRKSILVIGVLWLLSFDKRKDKFYVVYLRNAVPFIELQQAVQCCRKIRDVERAFWSLVYCGTLALTGERISSMLVYLRNAVPTAKEMYMKMMSKK